MTEPSARTSPEYDYAAARAARDDIRRAVDDRRSDFDLAGEASAYLAHAAACTAFVGALEPGKVGEDVVKPVHVVADAVRALANGATTRLRADPPAVMTARDLAALLGRGLHFAESLIASGRLRVMRHEGIAFVLREDLAALFQWRLCGDCSKSVSALTGDQMPSGFWRCHACRDGLSGLGAS